jgi:hypothetical protein
LSEKIAAGLADFEIVRGVEQARERKRARRAYEQMQRRAILVLEL